MHPLRALQGPQGPVKKGKLQLLEQQPLRLKGPDTVRSNPKLPEQELQWLALTRAVAQAPQALHPQPEERRVLQELQPQPQPEERNVPQELHPQPQPEVRRVLQELQQERLVAQELHPQPEWQCFELDTGKSPFFGRRVPPPRGPSQHMPGRKGGFRLPAKGRLTAAGGCGTLIPLRGGMSMNVYDFDNTILRGDSTARFCAFCLRHYPAVWVDLPGQALNALLFGLKLRKKQAFKERLLSFLRRIEDVDGAVARFWEENFCRVKPFYAETHRPDDVVISASPEFLIAPACARLGVACVMGSPVDRRTGVFHGPNCHGEEKVRRFRAAFGDAQIDEFYSDSHSDDPLAKLARRAIRVRGDRLEPWNG